MQINQESLIINFFNESISVTLYTEYNFVKFKINSRSPKNHEREIKPLQSTVESGASAQNGP